MKFDKWYRVCVCVSHARVCICLAPAMRHAKGAEVCVARDTINRERRERECEC